MKYKAYIIHSPSFPTELDFEKFNVWCEWHDPEELPYIKSLCSSEEEFQKLIINPHKDGKETYYPFLGLNDLPNQAYLYVKVAVKILEDIELMGYVSIFENEIISLTIWPDSNPDNEINFYRSDMLVAEDENPKSTNLLINSYDIASFNELYFYSCYKLCTGTEVSGFFKIGDT